MKKMDSFVAKVIERGYCTHSRGMPDEYFPCWTLRTTNGQMLYGVCGTRIRKAGFNGKISPKSIQQRR